MIPGRKNSHLKANIASPVNKGIHLFGIGRISLKIYASVKIEGPASSKRADDFIAASLLQEA